jgi:hypothetical protein
LERLLPAPHSSAILTALFAIVGVLAGLSVTAMNWAMKLPERIPRLETHLVVC